MAILLPQVVTQHTKEGEKEKTNNTQSSYPAASGCSTAHQRGKERKEKTCPENHQAGHGNKMTRAPCRIVSCGVYEKHSIADQVCMCPQCAHDTSVHHVWQCLITPMMQTTDSPTPTSRGCFSWCWHSHCTVCGASASARCPWSICSTARTHTHCFLLILWCYNPIQQDSSYRG